MPKIDKSVLTFGIDARVRDKKYLDSARDRYCEVSVLHDRETVVACHPRCCGTGGTGLKPSDDLVIFLCRGCHDELDQRVKADDWAGAEDWLIRNILYPMLRRRYAGRKQKAR